MSSRGRRAAAAICCYVVLCKFPHYSAALQNGVIHRVSFLPSTTSIINGKTHTNGRGDRQSTVELARSLEFNHISFCRWTTSHLTAQKYVGTYTELQPQYNPTLVDQSINTSVTALNGHASEQGLSLDDNEPKSNKLYALLTIVGMFMASALLVIASGPGAWRYYLAGGICATISHSFTTPIDVIKTRQQIDKSLKDLGLIKSGMKIVKDDGSIKALVAGLGPTTFGYLFEGALKFGIYEVLKPALRSTLAWLATITSISYLNSRILALLISGSVAGTVASIALCPMEALRIRLVAKPEFATGGWVNGGLTMIENEGIRGLSKGLSAMMSKQVPYTITKNVSFDLLTTMSYSVARAWGYMITKELKIFIPLVSAMAASVLSCISSQPGDMLLSVVNAEEGNRKTRDYAKDILNNNGFKGFFTGMRARFLHVGMIVTLQLLIYDFVKRLCGITATGL